MPKADLTKARLPRGFADRGRADLVPAERMLAAIRSVYERYGFEPVETPFVEFTEALGKFLPDLDRPNEGVFSFPDDDGAWLSLRYDLTAPLARHVAARLDDQSLTLPFRSYRSGWVFRNEKPGPGRFRQFMQFDADTVGSDSPAADAEMCTLMADTLEAVGIPRGDYVIRVSSRKILDGILGLAGLGPDDGARKLVVLRALDKLDRLGLDGVSALLGSGRRDESGDFTKGAGLDGQAIARILNATGWQEPDTGVSSAVGSGITLSNLEDSLRDTPIGSEGVAELRAIHRIVEHLGYGDDRIRIDPSVVRGLEYYTGAVFEAELTFEVADADGRRVRFGSVAGGGRYDGLVGRFREKEEPATGFSIGVSRLLAALRTIGSPLVADADAAGPVVVLVMDRDRLGDYAKIVADLRTAGIPAEMYLGTSGMKAQMRYADRRRAPCVVIQGTDERARDEVQIKDLRLGSQQAERDSASTNAEYRAQRHAQTSVKTADLVPTILKIRDLHTE